MIGKGVRSPCNTQFLIDDMHVTDKNIIVNKFNEFFANIGSSLAQHIPMSHMKPSEYLTNNYVNSLYIKPVDDAELCTVINNLRNSAAGLDNLKPEIIKAIYPSIMSFIIY